MLRRHAPYHSLISLLLLCGALAGCGQKGPLFLPPGTPPPPWQQRPKTPAAATHTAAVPASTTPAPASVTRPPRA